MTEAWTHQQQVVAACIPVLDEYGYAPPTGYPDGLALCILDSIWSIGVNYSHVENVLRRWKAHVAKGDVDPSFASASHLLESIDAVGPTEFANSVVRNRQRTSTTNGILKARAKRDAAALLASTTNTTTDFRDRATEHDLRAKWCAIRGQSSGIS